MNLKIEHKEFANRMFKKDISIRAIVNMTKNS